MLFFFFSPRTCAARYRCWGLGGDGGKDSRKKKKAAMPSPTLAPWNKSSMSYKATAILGIFISYYYYTRILSNNSIPPVTTLVYLQDVSRGYSSGFIITKDIKTVTIATENVDFIDLGIFRAEEYPRETSCKYTNVVTGVLELFERMNTRSGSLKSFIPDPQVNNAPTSI